MTDERRFQHIDAIQEVSDQVNQCLSDFPAITSGTIANKCAEIFHLSAQINSKIREFRATVGIIQERLHLYQANIFDPNINHSQWRWEQIYNQDEECRLLIEETTELQSTLFILDVLRWDLKSFNDTILELLKKL